MGALSFPKPCVLIWLEKRKSSLSNNVQRDQFRFIGPKSWDLSGRIWWNKSGSRGSFVGSHGYSEHSGCYDHFANFWIRKGFQMAMLDLPGHGLSEGRRGNIDDFGDYVKSFESFFRKLKELNFPGPYFLFAHSLGGLVGVRFLQTSDLAREFDICILSSPLFGLADQAFHHIGTLVQSDWGLRVLEIATSLVPNLNFSNDGGMSESLLTHDDSMIRKRMQDKLIQPVVTVNWTREFLKARRLAFVDVSKIQMPVGIFQSGDDRVVSTSQTKKFFEKLKISEKKLSLYPSLFHEILNEVGREQVMEDMYQWVESVLSAPPKSVRGST